MSFKQAEQRKESKYISVALYKPSHVTFLIFFISSCRFKLPLMSLPYSNTALLPPVSFLPLLSNMLHIQLLEARQYNYLHIVYVIAFKSVKRSKEAKYAIISNCTTWPPRPSELTVLYLEWRSYQRHCNHSPLRLPLFPCL